MGQGRTDEGRETSSNLIRPVTTHTREGGQRGMVGSPSALRDCTETQVPLEFSVLGGLAYLVENVKHSQILKIFSDYRNFSHRRSIHYRSSHGNRLLFRKKFYNRYRKSRR